MRRLRISHVIAALLLVGAIALGAVGGGEVSEPATLLDPPAWAFAIWGVIFAGWVVFAAMQLLPVWRDHGWIAASRWPLVIAALLSGGWINLVDVLPWYANVILYAVTVVVAVVAAAGAADAWSDGAAGVATASIATGLFAGWITMAATVSVATIVREQGWGDVVGAGGAPLAVALAAGATAVALTIVMVLPGSIGYAIGVAWGMTTIAVASGSVEPTVALACASAAILVLVAGLGRTSATMMITRGPAPITRGGRRTRARVRVRSDD